MIPKGLLDPVKSLTFQRYMWIATFLLEWDVGIFIAVLVMPGIL